MQRRLMCHVDSDSPSSRPVFKVLVLSHEVPVQQLERRGSR